MNKDKFVAINYITCEESYKPRFEQLFATRAGAIDRMPGFINLEILKPDEKDDTYLIVSHWKNEESFKAWQGSPEFMEGHKRGFDDIRKARAEGKKAPMTSNFKTYTVIAT